MKVDFLSVFIDWTAQTWRESTRDDDLEMRSEVWLEDSQMARVLAKPLKVFGGKFTALVHILPARGEDGSISPGMAQVDMDIGNWKRGQGKKERENEKTWLGKCLATSGLKWLLLSHFVKSGSYYARLWTVRKVREQQKVHNGCAGSGEEEGGGVGQVNVAIRVLGASNKGSVGHVSDT